MRKDEKPTAMINRFKESRLVVLTVACVSTITFVFLGVAAFDLIKYLTKEIFEILENKSLLNHISLFRIRTFKTANVCVAIV